MASEKVIAGWKDIAAYLDCGIRTAQRWAKEFGLPVRISGHRGQRAPVVALASDLDHWVHRSRVQAAAHNEEIIRKHLEIIKNLENTIAEQRDIVRLLRERRLSRENDRHSFRIRNG